MKITVRFRHINWSEDLHDEVVRRIQFAVDRHGDRVARVSVYLTDLNGPRGGVDKLCQITAELRGGRRIRILEKGHDLLLTVSRAARRLGYRMGRSIHRERMPAAGRSRVSIRTGVPVPQPIQGFP